MHLCQQGYPCKYLRMIDGTRGKCMCATCPISLQGWKVHDALTGQVTRYTVKRRRKSTDWEAVKEKRRRLKEAKS